MDSQRRLSSQRIEAGNSQHLRRVYGFRREEVSESANDRLGIFRPKDVFKRDVGSRHACGADSEKYQLGRRSSATNRLANVTPTLVAAALLFVRND
jgi:hypothetical protein